MYRTCSIPTRWWVESSNTACIIVSLPKYLTHSVLPCYYSERIHIQHGPWTAWMEGDTNHSHIWTVRQCEQSCGPGRSRLSYSYLTVDNTKIINILVVILNSIPMLWSRYLYYNQDIHTTIKIPILQSRYLSIINIHNQVPTIQSIGRTHS